MADVKTNEIFTRIQLKYDSYKNWVDNNPTLLSGEVAIAKLVTGTQIDVSKDTTNTAPVLFKVGPGAFNDLPWVSGLAADVYAWAKKATPDWTDFPALPITVVDNETGKFVTDFEYADNTLTIHRGNVEWDDIQNKPDLGVMSVTGKDAIVATGDEAVEVTLKIAEGEGKVGNVTLTQNADGLKADYDLVGGLEEFGIKRTEAAIENDNATYHFGKDEEQVRIDVSKIRAWEHVETTDLIAHGTLSVEQEATFSKSVKKVETIDHTSNAYEVATERYVDAGDAATLQAAKDYADAKPHENSAHTHSNGKGTTATGGGTTGDVKVDLNVAFELVDKTIRLYDKSDATKAALAELDATEFIADGMLASVTADQANNKLVFEWNTDAGVTKTEVELSSIADIYTGVTNTETVTTVKNTNEIEVTLVNDGVTEAKLEKNVRDALALARTALQEHQDISGKKDKQTAVADKGLTGAKVLGSLTQNENGEVNYTVRDLTPADIGAQIAGNYKTVQEAKEYTGATTKTVTDVKQNANGEVEVTYGDIAFPEAIKASGAATIATVADDVVTLKAGAVLSEDHVLANDANADITLAKVAKTGNVADLVQTENTYIVFNCGSATEVI